MNVHTDFRSSTTATVPPPSWCCLMPIGWPVATARKTLSPTKSSTLASITTGHRCAPGVNTFGLTQAEVAARANMIQGAYARMENSPKPRRASLKKIAKAMGLTVEQLDF